MNHEFGMLNQFEQEASLRFEPTSYQDQPHLSQPSFGLGLRSPQDQEYPSLGQGQPQLRLQEFTPLSLSDRTEELPQNNSQLHSLLTL